MKEFKIDSPDKGIENDIIEKINFLTKPKGSLGFLEELALRVSLIQQTLSPCLKNPYNVLFGGDHGVIEEGISLFSEGGDIPADDSFRYRYIRNQFFV